MHIYSIMLFIMAFKCFKPHLLNYSTDVPQTNKCRKDIAIIIVFLFLHVYRYFSFFLKQRCVKWTAVAMASVMVVCVGARRAGQELCVTRRPATHCAARTESVRRGSVSVTKVGQGSTAISVSGSYPNTYTLQEKM